MQAFVSNLIYEQKHEELQEKLLLHHLHLSKNSAGQWGCVPLLKVLCALKVKSLTEECWSIQHHNHLCTPAAKDAAHLPFISTHLRSNTPVSSLSRYDINKDFFDGTWL